jgi:5-methylthioadenosine/S-adenosylhomocysteine deaminase
LLPDEKRFDLNRKVSLLVLLTVLLMCGQVVAQEQFDLLVRNGLIVTMDSGRSVYQNGYIAVRDGEIARVGTSDELKREKLAATSEVNAEGKVVLPGLINTHTHVPMVLFRGFADDLELNEWLHKHIFPAEARFVTADFAAAGTRLALVEMIRGGTTTFADMYFFENEVAQASKKAGMRALLAPALMDFPTPENDSWEKGVEAFNEFADQWKDDPLITPCVGPHSIYTVSPDHLRESAALANRLKLPLHIHTAETEHEMEESKEKNSVTPVAHLDKLGVLGPNVIAAHCVHLDQADRATLTKLEVGIAHCPESNMKLCSGAAPIPELLEAGARIGLGTDGAASNNDLDMWGEMDTAAKLHKLITNDPTVLPAAQVLEMATIGGARALHMEHKIGSLEVGKRADIILVDLEAAHLQPLYNIYSQLVYAAKSTDVTHVWVDGRMLMRRRELLTLDEANILRQAAKYQKMIDEGRDATPEAPDL